MRVKLTAASYQNGPFVGGHCVSLRLSGFEVPVGLGRSGTGKIGGCRVRRCG